MASRLPFATPTINDNPNGWGPCTIPEQFKEVPYQPFSKSDRIGKVSDWTGITYQDRRYANRYTQYGSGANMFSYFHEEDENSFHLVDNKPTTKTFRSNFKRFQRTPQRAANYNRDVAGGNSKMQRLGNSGNKKSYGNYRRFDNRTSQRAAREPSVDVEASWEVLEEIEFSKLTKLSYEVEDCEDLKMCGSLEYYDKSYDRTTTKNVKNLQEVDRVFPRVTTSEDPVLRKFAQEKVGNIFATDVILATLMACPRSVYSWDIVVTRKGDQLFFDKREDSDLDYLTINETALEPPSDEADAINRPASLKLEATYVNRNFSQQVLKSSDGRVDLGEPSPFDSSEEELAPVGYRYRKWSIGDGLNLVARCEVDAATKNPDGSNGYMSVKALYEYDPKITNVDWRKKLDSQRGAVLATELKNNSNKLAKWTAQALLAGANSLKLGYVSRAHPQNSSKHVILGTQFYKPKEFATQINLNIYNAWGILRTMVDLIMKRPEGKYLILKDPNKAVIRLYKVPENAFDGSGRE
eukprot:Nk52_evm10s442 gene=Nk52_evmTU10s442